VKNQKYSIKLFDEYRKELHYFFTPTSKKNKPQNKLGVQKENKHLLVKCFREYA